MTRERTTSVWRRPVSWIAAYALALHTILIGLAGLPVAASPTSNDTGFEICHTGGVDTGTDRGAPDHHAKGEHCKGCIAGGGALAPPLPAVVAWSFTAGHRIAHAIESERPASPELYREQARGPPAKA